MMDYEELAIRVMFPRYYKTCKVCGGKLIPIDACLSKCSDCGAEYSLSEDTLEDVFDEKG